MANEITLSASLQVVNGNLNLKLDAGSLNFDQDTQGAHAPVVIVGTSEEDLDLGDIATNGWILLRNLDGTNFVKFGPKDTTMTEFGRLEAGEIALFRLAPGVTLRWVADTAACRVQVLAIED